MTKIILVGVDGSDSARKAATRAAELAASTGATLHVLTAVESTTVTTYADGATNRTVTPGEEADAVIRDITTTLAGVVPNVESSQMPGKAAHVLVEEAKRLGADLIVVGNRRVQGIGRILGSVATDVAHHAPCDVYIVKTV